MTRGIQDGSVIVHYGGGITGSTTVAAAAERLGISEAMYRRVLTDLVVAGYLRPRPDGSYEADGPVGAVPA